MKARSDETSPSRLAVRRRAMSGSFNEALSGPICAHPFVQRVVWCWLQLYAQLEAQKLYSDSLYSESPGACTWDVKAVRVLGMYVGEGCACTWEVLG